MHGVSFSVFFAYPSTRKARVASLGGIVSDNCSQEVRSDRGGIIALIGILIFFFFIVLMVAGSLGAAISQDTPVENGIGVVEIRGTIATADSTVKVLQKFQDDDDIKAILVRIDSPGGSVSASQEMVEAIRGVTKPIVISMGDMAASGGYYVACAGPKIYANAGTLTGSIGVISQVMDLQDVLSFFKIKVHTVKTGALKDAGSPYRSFDDADRAYFTKLGLEIFDQFVSHVAEARHKTHDEIAAIADGRVWTGREATELGLIDEIGGFYSAIQGLKEMAHMTGNHTLVYPKKKTDTLLEELLLEGSSRVGAEIRDNLEAIIHRPDSFEYRYTTR